MTSKRLTLISVIIFFYIQLLPAEHIPDTDTFNFQYQGRLTVIGDLGNWNPYLEVLGDQSTSFELEYYHLLTGSYYRLHKNLKIGAFYLLQAGVRHDDDWVNLNPGWEWQDTINRLEHNLVLDLTPRFLIPHILNKNAVGSLKTRYQYNFFNNHQTLLVKPGFTYFYMKDRKPVWNTSLAYSFYIPLNFSETLLYEHGPYINFLYHLNDLIKLEARGNFHIRTWTTGEDSIALGDSYSTTEKGLNIGIGIIFTP